MKRIIGIDYGLRRVGIAVTDPLQLIATPLHTVATQEILGFLQLYLQKEAVAAFVVGFPGDLKDQRAPIIKGIRQFIQLLQQHFPSQPTYQQNERYTSRLASWSLATGGFKKKDRQHKPNIDKVSAALILQSFLYNRKN
jgi:putative Holliday junction resolvase